MKFITGLILLLFGCPFFSFCQLDTSFNHIGKIVTQFGACRKLFIDTNNNRIMTIGGISGSHIYPIGMSNINANGSLDEEFSVNMFNYTFQLFTTPPNVTNICYAHDGKLLFSGYAEVYWKQGWSSDDFTCLKVDQNGRADMDFGDSGMVITDIAHWWYGYWMEHGDDEPSAIALQSNGKIILYGNVNRGDALGWVRYSQEGKIDSSFGAYGIATVIIPGILQATNDMAVMPDGRIVSAFMGTGSTNMGVIRLLPNGIPDSSFNQTGISGYYGGSWLTYCRALCLQPDGKVLLAGFSDSGIVARFNLSGSLDTTFGHKGAVRLACTELGGMALAPDGKILVAGNDDSCFLIFRCLPNGRLDTTFGTGGMLRSRPDSTGNNRASCIALQPDGKILVGGHSEHRDYVANPPQVWDNFVLVRYLPDGRPAPKESVNQNGSLLSIFPNPAGTKISLKWSGIPKNDITATIYDMQGRKVLVKQDINLSKEPALLDISALAPGVYFVQISGNGGFSEKYKFVKE